MNESLYTTVTLQQMKSQFESVLLKHGFSSEKASACAEIFTSNSIDGVYTHGVNRFPRFIEYIKNGHINVHAEPSVIHKFGSIEQWNGNLGPGPLNAIAATEKAMELSAENGIGCVAISNTNHWMRAGYYAWLAAKKGYALIAWTNTIAIMPAHNAVDSRLGNNPIVMAVPYKKEAIVLDMAMSQFSYGAMEQAAMKNEELKVDGGYDADGHLTKDPSAILKSKRPLAIGYWKGAGLSLLLDILATILSSGLSTKDITTKDIESAVSQVFIAIDLSKLSNHSIIADTINKIIDDYTSSVPVDELSKISYPGERVLATRKENTKNGIPVLKTVWQDVLNL